MALTLTPDHRLILQRDAERAYPHEGCGLLLGHFNSATDEHCLVRIQLLNNAWPPNIAENLSALADSALAGSAAPDNAPLTQARRYWIDPKDMLMAQRSARAEGLSIIGVYHSHPDHPAIPSECDRKLAWSNYAYLIVSVQGGHATDLKCWQLDDHHQFQPSPLTVTDHITDRISPLNA